jgi:hypothetical protein
VKAEPSLAGLVTGSGIIARTDWITSAARVVLVLVPIPVDI